MAAGKKEKNKNSKKSKSSKQANLDETSKNAKPIKNEIKAEGTETEAKIEPTDEEETQINKSPSGGEEKEEGHQKKPIENWSNGEKILCFHGPLIYEAKIQNVQFENGTIKYFIHYHGWNKNWDEWVPQARMLKYTDKNVAVQKDLIRAHEEKNNEKRRRGLKRRHEESTAAAAVSTDKATAADHVFAVPKAPSPVPPRGARGRKAGLRPQKRELKSEEAPDLDEEEDTVGIPEPLPIPPPDNTVESQEIFRSKVEIRIKIPDELKSYIVDDWEQVTRNKNLCILPAKLTVEQLLENYTRARTANKSELASKNNRGKAIEEVTAGIREYFNVMLPAQLLFKQERSQFEQMKKDAPSLVPLKVYGAPHLLRLFTKIGETLTYTPLGEKSVSLLLFYLHDILNYMKKNSSIIFSNSDYAAAGGVEVMGEAEAGPSTSKV